MKKFFTITSALVMLLSLVVFLFPQQTEAYVSVRGYYRSNGTYVQPYVRSNPNALRYDNYNYSGGSLYNPSYYSSTRNYSSSWYTPSYLTDTNYYTGKSLYNSYRGLYAPSYNFWGY